MAQKVKNDPNIESKSNARVEGNIENESCSTSLVDPKTVFEPHNEPKKSPKIQKEITHKLDKIKSKN